MNNTILDFKKLPEYFIGGLFFLFPILAILVKDWVSFTFLVLTLGGMTYGLRAWKILSVEEKRIFIGFAVFCGLIALSFINVDNMRSGFRHFEKYLSFLLAIFPYLLLRRLNINFAKYFIAGVVVAPLAWIAYYYILSDVVRFSGAYYAIFVGDVAVLIASMSVAYFITLADSSSKKILSGTIFLLATLVSILSETLGAWIYFPVLIVILVIMHQKYFTKRHWMFICVSTFLVLVFLFSFPPERVQNRISAAINNYQLYQAGESNNTSIGLRIDMWKDSLNMIVEYPVVGIGIGDFEAHTKELKAAGISNIAEVFGHAHNIYLNTFATTGILGFMGLLVFVFLWPLRYFVIRWAGEGKPEQKFYVLSGVILITGFMVFGLTETWLARNPFVRTYVIIFVLLLSSIELNNKLVKSQQ